MRRRDLSGRRVTGPSSDKRIISGRGEGERVGAGKKEDLGKQYALVRALLIKIALHRISSQSWMIIILPRWIN